MRLEQLMAFSINDDAGRQEQVWEFVAQSHNRALCHPPNADRKDNPGVGCSWSRRFPDTSLEPSDDRHPVCIYCKTGLGCKQTG